MGVENYIFWSEIESGFEEPSGTPPPRIPRSTPPRIQTQLMQTLTVAPSVSLLTGFDCSTYIVFKASLYFLPNRITW